MKANRKTWPVMVPPLIERRKVIKTRLISDGKTGRQWVRYADSHGLKLETTIRKFLLSDKFKPTASGTVHNVTIFLCWTRKGGIHSVANIRKKIRRRKLGSIHEEVICLILKSYTKAQLREHGIFAVICNAQPFRDAKGNLVQIGLDCFSKDYGLGAYGADPDDMVSEVWGVACSNS